jgi:Trk K+ transport system NAD-binding subunit
MGEVKVGATLDGKTLRELGLRDRFRVNVILVLRGRGKGAVENLEPEPDLGLMSGDICLVVGQRERINRFERECGVTG